MFTGIVEALGSVAELGTAGDGARMVVAHPLGPLTQGESVSVNGCCVTVTAVGDDRFAVDLMGETLDRTALGGLRRGSTVNLERALAASGRLGGHLVQGHVDGVGTVVDRTSHDGWTTMTVAAPAWMAPYVVEKGAIAVDGVSLTVATVDDARSHVAFSVGLIPHTLAVTVLGDRRVGDHVNLEVDVVAKYVERLLGAGAATPYTARTPPTPPPPGSPGQTAIVPPRQTATERSKS